MHVAPALQCGGVGGALLRHSISKLSCQKVHLLGSVNAAAFYEKQGFKALDHELADAGIRYVSVVLPIQKSADIVGGCEAWPVWRSFTSRGVPDHSISSGRRFTTPR